ncbi:MAG: DUF3520 domain-containing protein [Myxococcales bacterium]|nr:DUF3520 domain-containing protein [Myxococcales bacterium]
MTNSTRLRGRHGSERLGDVNRLGVDESGSGFVGAPRVSAATPATLVALYEIRSAADTNVLPQLRYQTTGVPRGSELAFVKVRHKAPAGGRSQLSTLVGADSAAGAPPSPAFTFSPAVAAFG